MRYLVAVSYLLEVRADSEQEARDIINEHDFDIINEKKNLANYVDESLEVEVKEATA